MSDHEHAIRSEPAAAPSAPADTPLVAEPNAPVSQVLGALASADAERRDRVVRSLQRTVGNRAVSHAIAVARQPSGGGGGDPDMTGGSIIYKDGKWYWKGSLQGVGSSPELALDPTLQVRLVGHASSEGSDEVNLELSKRRARAVKARLDDKKLGARVMDFVGGSKPAGGVPLEFGMWACGEANAAQGEAKPEDRKVAVLFLRNAPVGTGPLKLELPAPGQ